MNYNFITSTGTVIPDTAEIRNQVIAEYVEALGISEEAARDNSTLEGRLVDMETQARKAVLINNSALANQINPNLAEEGFFDAIFALFGGARKGATRSTVTVLATGVDGTVIPAGSFIRNGTTKTLWRTINEAVIAGGSASIDVESVDTGEIVGAAGDLNEIVSGVVGWETVTNTQNATLGRELQSLNSGKLSRVQQLAKNAGSTMGAAIANVSALGGVRGVSGRENKTNSTQVIDGITMPPKSTWICVDGGEDSAIAEQYAIHTHGTAFYGFINTVAGEYTDPVTGQPYNSGTVPVNFDRPNLLPIKIEVTAKLTSSTDLISQIKLAVQEWISGNIDGYAGGMLGSDISPFEISSALNEYFSAASIFVRRVRVTTVADNSYSTNDISVSLWQKAAVIDSDIEVISG